MYGRELTLDDFAKKRGHVFPVEANGRRIDLTLRHVQELPGSGRQGGSFRLEFLGPQSSYLPQGTYPFQVGSLRIGIFIVPLGASEAGVRYEAIFY